MVRMSTTNAPLQVVETTTMTQHHDGESEDGSPRHSPSSTSDFSVISNSGSQSPGVAGSGDGGAVVNGPTSSSSSAAFSHFQDMNFLLNSAVPDLTFEQMQNALSDLLRENLQLKDDVQQSNVAMREQFELMVKLQMHIEGIQKEQTLKHERARAVIEELREENAKLHESASAAATATAGPSSASIVEQLQAELAELRTKCKRNEEESEHRSIVNHQLSDEMGQLGTDMAHLKSSYMRLLDEKRALETMNAELQAMSRQRSPDQFYDANDGVTDATVNQGFLVVPSKENAESDMTLVDEKTVKDLLAQLSYEQSKNGALSAELNEQRALVSTLSKQIEGQEEVIRRLVQDGPAAIQQQGVLLLAELKAAEHKFNLASSYLQKYRDRCLNLDHILGVYQERLQDVYVSGGVGGLAIDRLGGEIMSLRKILAEEQTKNADEKQFLMEAREKFKALFENHQKLEDAWASYTREQVSRGRQSEAYYNLQEKYYQEKVDSLMAKLVTVEDKLASKEEHLAKMLPEMQKCKQEAETVPILQTQVELYKTDFRAERDAREKLHEEKERISEEMRHLQTRHNEALEKMAQLLGNTHQTSPSSTDTTGHSRRHSHGIHGRSHRRRSSRSPPLSAEQPVAASSTNVPVRDVSPTYRNYLGGRELNRFLAHTLGFHKPRRGSTGHHHPSASTDVPSAE